MHERQTAQQKLGMEVLADFEQVADVVFQIRSGQGGEDTCVWGGRIRGGFRQTVSDLYRLYPDACVMQQGFEMTGG